MFDRKKYWLITGPGLIVWTIVKFKVLPIILHSENMEAFIYLIGALGIAFIARTIAKN